MEAGHVFSEGVFVGAGPALQSHAGPSASRYFSASIPLNSLAGAQSSSTSRSFGVAAPVK